MTTTTVTVPTPTTTDRETDRHRHQEHLQRDLTFDDALDAMLRRLEDATAPEPAGPRSPRWGLF